MQFNALLFHTALTTVFGTGSIDLANEKLDLTLNPKTKKTSFLELGSPIHVHGSLGKPTVEVDTARTVTRGLEQSRWDFSIRCWRQSH